MRELKSEEKMRLAMFKILGPTKSLEARLFRGEMLVHAYTEVDTNWLGTSACSCRLL